MVCYPPFTDQPNALNWEDAVALADKALYHVKRHGRDGWCMIQVAPGTDPSSLQRSPDESVEELLARGLVTVEQGSGEEG